MWEFKDRPVAGEESSNVAGLLSAVGQMAVSSTDVCMMFRSRSHTSKIYTPSYAENIVMLRRHCELYSSAVQPRVDDDVVPHTQQYSGVPQSTGMETIIAHSPSDGMTVHERMKHWWSTRVCADSECLGDDSAPHVHSTTMDQHPFSGDQHSQLQHDRSLLTGMHNSSHASLDTNFAARACACAMC